MRDRGNTVVAGRTGSIESAGDGIDMAGGQAVGGGHGNYAYGAVAGVSDKYVAGQINGNASRSVQERGSGESSVAGEAGGPGVARDGVDVAGDHTVAGGGGNFANGVVSGIRDKDVAGMIDKDAIGQVDQGSHGRNSVAIIVGVVRLSDDGLNISIGSQDFANDAGFRLVGKEQIVRDIGGQSGRSSDDGVGGGSTVAAEAEMAVTCDGVNVTRVYMLAEVGARDGCDLANSVAIIVSDKDVTSGIFVDAGRKAQLCGGGRAAVARVAMRQGSAGHSIDIANGHAIGGDSGDFTDNLVIDVGDENVVVGIDKQGVRAVKKSRGGRAAVTTVIAQSLLRAGDGVDVPRGLAASGDRGDFADHVVAAFSDENITGGVKEYIVRIGKLRGGGDSAVAGIACHGPGAGDGVNVAFGLAARGYPSDFADDFIEAVGNKNVAKAIDVDAVGSIKLRCGGGGAVTSPAALPSHSSYGVNIAGGHAIGGDRGHFANNFVIGIGDKNVAGSIEAKIGGLVQLSAGGRAAIAAETGGAVARDNRERAAGIYFEKKTVVVVEEVQIASGIFGHASGTTNAGIGGGSDIVRTAADDGGNDLRTDRERRNQEKSQGSEIFQAHEFFNPFPSRELRKPGG